MCPPLASKAHPQGIRAFTGKVRQADPCGGRHTAQLGTTSQDSDGLCAGVAPRHRKGSSRAASRHCL